MKVLICLKKYRYMQYMCVFIATLLQASLSIASVWISPVLPLLTSNNTPLNAPLTKIEESWVVSGEKLGAVIGCALAAFFTNKVGRKQILLISGVPVFLSMISSAFNKIALVLILLRIVMGISSGISFVVLPLYIGEVSDKDIRGKLCVAQIILSTLGGVFVYSVGPFIDFKSLCISCSIFPLAFMILFAFMPESPYQLVKKGKVNSAVKSLRQLSRKDLVESDIQLRLQEIQNFVTMNNEKKIVLKDLILNKVYRKTFLIVLGIRCILCFSGLHVLAGYLQTIIDSSDSSISAKMSSLVFGVIKLPSAVLAAFLVDRLGRRPLLVISSIGCAVTLLAEGVYFYLKETTDVSHISWLPTTGLSLYLVSIYFGIEVLPVLVVGEVFTVDVKSVASGCVSCIGFGINFVLLQIFKPVSDALGVYTMFWFFGTCCILSSLFGIFILPETKGKTFSEIQEMLSEKKTEYIDLEIVERKTKL